MEKIEEAIQTACDLFVDKGEGISAPGQVYTWVRTTAHRILNREEDQRLRELPVDPTHASLSEAAAKDPGPAEEANRRDYAAYDGDLDHAALGETGAGRVHEFDGTASTSASCANSS